MTGASDADATNLTGVWHGLYTCSDRLGSISFVATLIEARSHFTGSTHEPRMSRDAPSETLYATLQGHRQNRAVAFIKTYDPISPRFGTVHYDGTLSDDGTEIEGRWLLPSGRSGKFMMIRSSRGPAAHVKRVSERIGSA